MIKAEIKVNNIYYENKEKGKLDIFPATATDERMTISQAKKVLKENRVYFTRVLKVIVSYEQVEIPREKFNEYKKIKK